MSAGMKNDERPKAGNRVISVGGGKGGVGKSIVSANLAIALARLGHRVVLVDLDLGAANQHLLLGVPEGTGGITALLEGTASDVESALAPTAVPRLSLLQGSSGVLGAANITYQSKLRLLRKLRALDATVILDVGAGVGYNALDFFLLGTNKVLVVTPQVTSIHDAYSFLKSAVLRLLQHHAESAIDHALLEPALASAESAKVAQMLTRLQDIRPDLGGRVARLLQGFGACLVGNQLQRRAESGILVSVSRMMSDYLGIDVPVLGCLPESPAIIQSVNDRRPVMLGRPSIETRAVEQIAEALFATEATDELDFAIDEVVEAAPPPVPAAAPVVAGAPSVPKVIIAEEVNRAPAANQNLPHRPPQGLVAPPMGLPRRKITLPGMTPARAAGGRG
jgi:flagellar biosynthesis protein FlhG